MTPETAINNALHSCRRSALHLEMRDAYMLDDPELIAWRSGMRYHPDDRDSWWRPWLDLIAATVSRGVGIRRARIVSEPISDYIRYEHDNSFTNIAAGEQLRWLPRRQATDIALPGNDFWLFDDETLLANHFDGNGNWIDVETVTNPDVVKLCATAFETVWDRALPHQQYRPT